MTDEAESGRRRSSAPAPPPRQSSRPPEPRPRTHAPDPTLAAPPRLIRPSEHLAIVERNRKAALSPVRSPEVNRPDRSMPYHSPVLSPDNTRPGQSDALERRTAMDSRVVESRQGLMDRRQIMPSVSVVERPVDSRIMESRELMDRRQVIPSASVVERAVDRERSQRPPHLMPSVTVVHGPRPTLPPPVPGHRSVAPPPMRMPAPIPQPVIRLPQQRTDIQKAKKDHVPKVQYLRIRCPICFKIFGKEPAVSTKCGHVFCRECLNTWMQKKRPCLCPICSTKINMHGGKHVVYLEDMSQENERASIFTKSPFM